MNAGSSSSMRECVRVWLYSIDIDVKVAQSRRQPVRATALLNALPVYYSVVKFSAVSDPKGPSVSEKR